MTGDAQRRTRELLLDDERSDDERLELLVPIVYRQLRAAAERQMAAERAGHTLQATALVHEAFLRLVGDRSVPWTGRAHFYAAAAEAMRRVLLDHARSRGRAKRGGGAAMVSLADVGDLADLASMDSRGILALDEAVRRLEDETPETAAVVRLRFYAGLSIDQTAEALGTSPRQVDRLWAYARAWLHRCVSSMQDDG